MAPGQTEWPAGCRAEDHPGPHSEGEDCPPQAGAPSVCRPHGACGAAATPRVTESLKGVVSGPQAPP